MKLLLVSVRDRAAGAFGRPMFVQAAGQAIRSFQDEINRQAADNVMNAHPDDFDLYVIGEFDDSTGRISGREPEQLAVGKQLFVKKD